MSDVSKWGIFERIYNPHDDKIKCAACGITILDFLVIALGSKSMPNEIQIKEICKDHQENGCVMRPGVIM